LKVPLLTLRHSRMAPRQRLPASETPRVNRAEATRRLTSRSVAGRALDPPGGVGPTRSRWASAGCRERNASDVFKLLGFVVALYDLYAISRGEVYARSGWRGRTVSRSESPRYYWVVIGIYGLLAIALVTVF